MFSIWKSFGKTNKTKTIEDAAEKQTKVIEGKIENQPLDLDQKPITDLFSKDFFSEEAIYELNKIKEIEEQKINRDNLIYKLDNKKGHKTYDF